jgi:hypothetical protein
VSSELPVSKQRSSRKKLVAHARFRSTFEIILASSAVMSAVGILLDIDYSYVMDDYFYVEYDGDVHLTTKQARRNWENAFVNTFIAPVLQVCEIVCYLAAGFAY